MIVTALETLWNMLATFGLQVATICKRLLHKRYFAVIRHTNVPDQIMMEIIHCLFDTQGYNLTESPFLVTSAD